MNRSELAERVRAGAQLLDHAIEGWPHRVKPERLEIHSLHRCVLGQLYGDYHEGARQLQLSSEAATQNGFFTQEEDHAGDAACREYAELGALWKEEIALRRSA